MMIHSQRVYLLYRQNTPLQCKPAIHRSSEFILVASGNDHIVDLQHHPT